MEDQALSHNFLSAIFGIFGIFLVEICGRKNVRRKLSDRKKWIEFPLFSSYLFARIEIKDSIFVLQTHGVSSLVKFGEEVAIVQD